MKIHLVVRWLGRSSEVKAQFKDGAIATSSVTSAGVFNHLLKSGLRLLGHRNEADISEETRLDGLCGFCSG